MQPDNALALVGSTIDHQYEVLEFTQALELSDLYKIKRIRTPDARTLRILRASIAADHDNVKRFSYEAKKLSSLGANAPSVAKVFDFGIYNGQPYTILEYLCGQTLSDHCRSGALNEETVVSVFSQICQGIAYCHKQGFLMRAISPSRIVLVPDQGPATDKRYQAKIVDFTYIQDVSDKEKVPATKSPLENFAEGSLYASPEQRQGKPADVRSDVYAVGCMMYEALSGSPPFSEERGKDLDQKHTSDTVPNVASTGCTVSESLANIVTRAMAKPPQERYQSMDDLYKALVPTLEQDHKAPEHKAGLLDQIQKFFHH